MKLVLVGGVECRAYKWQDRARQDEKDRQDHAIAARAAAWATGPVTGHPDGVGESRTLDGVDRAEKLILHTDLWSLSCWGARRPAKARETCPFR